MRTVHAHHAVTGAHLRRLNEESFNWQQSINSIGDFAVSARDPGASLGWLLEPYKCIIVIRDGSKVIHAGYVDHAMFSRAKGCWAVKGGDFMTVLEKRLVLNHALSSSWKDGNVKVDEDHPSGNWPLKIKGSYSDLISKLVSETLKWGTLPVDVAVLTGGNHERTYNSYDLATVADRIIDIGNLEDAPEFRFDAFITATGAIRFKQKTSADDGEIIDNSWKWNVLVPGSGVILGDGDADGAAACCQSFATGGRDNDKLLVARYTKAPADGFPVLQIANTEHSSVSELGTLQGYVKADVKEGSGQQRTYGILADGDRYNVHVGDHADVRYGTKSDDVLHLKVVDVSGSSKTSMLTLQCKERR